jgi:hypothetical protein
MIRTANLDPASAVDAPHFLNSIAAGPVDQANGRDVEIAIAVVASLLRASEGPRQCGEFRFFVTYEYATGRCIERLARATGEIEPGFGLPAYRWIEQVGANMPQDADAVFDPGMDEDRHAFAVLALGWARAAVPFFRPSVGLDPHADDAPAI